MNERTKRPLRKERPGFDVVCVVGRVEFGAGERTPREVAFELIANHGAEGTFTFPNEDGSECRVTVEHN